MNQNNVITNIKMAIDIEKLRGNDLSVNIPDKLETLGSIDAGSFYLLCKELALNEISLSLRPKDFLKFRLRVNNLREDQLFTGQEQARL